MQLLELLGRDLGGGAHQQILGALRHREQRDLAQIVLAAEQSTHQLLTDVKTAAQQPRPPTGE